MNKHKLEKKARMKCPVCDHKQGGEALAENYTCPEGTEGWESGLLTTCEECTSEFYVYNLNGHVYSEEV